MPPLLALPEVPSTLRAHPGWHFTEDDDMGHSPRQAELIVYLLALLRLLFRRKGLPWYVGFDAHIALDPRDERVTVAPDLYVLPQPDPPTCQGATWSPWANGGVVPLLAVEFVSLSNRKKD